MGREAQESLRCSENREVAHVTYLRSAPFRARAAWPMLTPCAVPISSVKRVCEPD